MALRLYCCFVADADRSDRVRHLGNVGQDDAISEVGEKRRGMSSILLFTAPKLIRAREQSTSEREQSTLVREQKQASYTATTKVRERFRLCWKLLLLAAWHEDVQLPCRTPEGVYHQLLVFARCLIFV